MFRCVMRGSSTIKQHKALKTINGVYRVKKRQSKVVCASPRRPTQSRGVIKGAPNEGVQRRTVRRNHGPVGSTTSALVHHVPHENISTRPRLQTSPVDRCARARNITHSHSEKIFSHALTSDMVVKVTIVLRAFLGNDVFFI